MKPHKLLAALFISIAIGAALLFFNRVDFPVSVEGYFQRSFYGQFGPIAICVELLFAGMLLSVKHERANFALALFSFTAILDPIFNVAGLFSSAVPVYMTIIFLVCAIVSFWIAFSNAFNLGRISFFSTLWSFLLGVAVELFFNYI